MRQKGRVLSKRF